MLRLTRTAIGLLTAQYRSVLRKCWAINVGIFGLMGKAVADTIQGTLSAFGVNVTDVLSMMRSLDSMLGIQRHPDVEHRGTEGSSDAFGITSFLQNDWILRPWLRMTRKGATLPVALVAATVMATTLTVMPNEAEAASGTGVLCYLSDGTVKYEAMADTCTSGTKLATMGAINSSANIGDYSTLLGYNAEAIGDSSTGLGYNARATDYSTAVGGSAEASGYYSTALGYFAQATGESSTALGREAKAVYNSTAVGYNASADVDAVALGNAARAASSNSTALGNYASATNSFSTAVGYNAYASGGYSTALGQGAQATKLYSTALGHDTQAAGENSTALGYYAQAYATGSVALGNGAQAYAYGSVALGQGSVAGIDSDATIDQYVVSVGSGNSGPYKYRRIINVAYGTGDYDAVNVAQLREAIATAGGGGTWGSITGTITAQTDLMTHLSNNYYEKL